MSSPSPTPARPAVWNREPLPHVTRIIAIASGKGGVGKSTVTVNLAHALTAQGKHVGILDADIYGPSIPRMLGLETRLQPELVDGKMIPPIAHDICAMSVALVMGDQAAVMRAPMVTKTLTQLLRMTRWGNALRPLDVLLVDLPPGTGDVHLSLAQSVPVDGAIIVTTPQIIATMDAEKSAVMFQKLTIPILGIIENMSYFEDEHHVRQSLFGEGGGAHMAQQFQTKLLGTLPLDPHLGKAADTGERYFTTHPNAPAISILSTIASAIAL